MPDVTPMLIDGEQVTADEVSEIRSPYDGSVVGSVPRGTEHDIDRAVAAALARWRSGPLPTHERAAILDRAATAVSTHAEELAQLIAAEAAKPINTARTEASRAVDTFRFSAAVARTLAGDVVPLDASTSGEGKLGFTLRVPVGVVAAISPFNFPLNLVAHKVAPAVAAGCAVVLKPASATPLTALRLASILHDECGLPAGWLNVVTCPGSVAEHLATHPDVAMVTFTGSADVGWHIRARAPRTKVSLELGNNTPVIVEPSAPVAATAAKIATTGFAFAGQSCISVQRVYVHASIAEQFVEELVAHVEELRLGDPLDDETQVSALITSEDTDRVRSVLEEAVAAGARCATGGAVDPNGILRPTVLTDVRSDMAVSATEVFGPVVTVQAYDSLDEAIEFANDTRYGLQAGIFTEDLSSALRAARELDFGGVTVNEAPTWRADQMPYGGVRESGNTKEGPAWAVRAMTEERLVAIHG